MLISKKNKSFIKLILAGITGLLPFFMWLLFSLWYYGVPFPTTYYAKLGTNIPFLDIFTYGVLYLAINFLVDILFGTTLIFIIVQSIKRGTIKHKVFAISMVFRLIYLITIGGDFMYGRMLTDIFSLVYVSIIPLEKKILSAISIRRGLLCLSSSAVFFLLL